MTLEHRLAISKAKKGKGIGAESPRWKAGIVFIDGYKYISVNDHPYSKTFGGITKYYLEHRLIIEKYIGRILEPHETVHHIDGDKLNNQIENLMLCETENQHNSIHAITKPRNIYGQFVSIDSVVSG